MRRSIALLIVIGAASVSAETVALQSNAITPDSCASSPVCEWNNISGYGNEVTVIPVANRPGPTAWATSSDGAQWISYENSGWNFSSASPVAVVPNDIPGSACPGYAGGEMTVAASTWSPSQIAACNASSPSYTTGQGPGTPNAIFYEQFTDPNPDVMLTLSIWADDTVAVYLNGVEIVPANLTETTHCDAPAPGFALGASECANGEQFVNLSVPSGTNTLEFDVYQISGGTYGVMWDGSFTDALGAPEPGSLALLGTGLVAFGLVRRKRQS